MVLEERQTIPSASFNMRRNEFTGVIHAGSFDSGEGLGNLAAIRIARRSRASVLLGSSSRAWNPVHGLPRYRRWSAVRRDDLQRFERSRRQHCSRIGYPSYSRLSYTLASALSLRSPVTPIVEIRWQSGLEGTAVGLERKRGMRNQQVREYKRWGIIRGGEVSPQVIQRPSNVMPVQRKWYRSDRPASQPEQHGKRGDL